MRHEEVLLWTQNNRLRELERFMELLREEQRTLQRERDDILRELSEWQRMLEG